MKTLVSLFDYSGQQSNIKKDTKLNYFKMGKPKIEETIKSIACMFTGIEAEKAYSKRREREFVETRYFAMLLMRLFTRFSMQKIGVLVGRKNHDTVWHGINTITGHIEVYDRYRKDAKEMCDYLMNIGFNPVDRERLIEVNLLDTAKRLNLTEA